MSHIFISYSHKDSDFAHELAGILENLYFEVWIDDRIDYGSAWPRVIQEKVDTCDAFIVIMTPRSYESNWVQNELTRAQNKKKPIFPLLLEGDEAWLSVQTIQYVDVRGGRLPPIGFIQKLAQTTLQQRTQKGEKFPIITRLSRVRQGKQLLSIVSGVLALLADHDEPGNETEMELIRNVLQGVEDLDSIDELGTGVQVEVAFSLSRQIEALEANSLYVYAGRIKENLQFGKATIENAELAIVVITRQNRDSILNIYFHEDGP
jgi:hypothetical protein